MSITSKSTIKTSPMATNDPKQQQQELVEYSFPSNSCFPTLPPKKGPRKKSSKSKKRASYGKKNRNNGSVSEEQKAWEFVRVIPASEKVDCDAEGCDKIAAVLWETRVAPLKVWKGCEGCQAAKFGGWLQGAKPPRAKASPALSESAAVDSGATSEGLETEASVSENDTQVTPVPSKLAAATNGKEESGTVEPSNDTALAKDQTDTKTGSTAATEATMSVTRNQEDDEGWVLAQVLPAKSFLNNPTKCSVCKELPACLVYSPTLDPEEKWWYCLDCQEQDFGGWPETMEEMPVQHLSKAHMSAMSKHCSKEQNGFHQFPAFDNLLLVDDEAETGSDASSAAKESSAGTCTAGKKSALPKNDGAVVIAGDHKRNNGLVTPSPRPPSTRASNNKKAVPLASFPDSSSSFCVIHRVFCKGCEEPNTPEPKIVIQQPAYKRLKLRDDNNK